MIDLLGVTEVFETMQAQIDQDSIAKRVRVFVIQQVGGGLREKHLSAMRDVTQAGRAVHGVTKIIIVPAFRFPRQQGHTDAQDAKILLGSINQRSLRLPRRAYRAARIGEHGAHAIPDRFEDVALAGFDGFAQEGSHAIAGPRAWHRDSVPTAAYCPECP